LGLRLLERFGERGFILIVKYFVGDPEENALLFLHVPYQMLGVSASSLDEMPPGFGVNFSKAFDGAPHLGSQVTLNLVLLLYRLERAALVRNPFPRERREEAFFLPAMVVAISKHVDEINKLR
jgi:hypothetical protein